MSEKQNDVTVDVPENSNDDGGQDQKFESVYHKVVHHLAHVRDRPFKLLARHPDVTRLSIYSIIFVLYNIYFVGVLFRRRDNDLDWEWCDGIGFLVIITALVYVGMLYYLIFVPFLSKRAAKYIMAPIGQSVNRVLDKHKIIRQLLPMVFGLAILAAVIVFLVIDSEGERERLVSAAGVVVFIFIGFLCSAHPADVRWRHVFWGIGLEFTFGLLVLRWEVGRNIFECLGDKVSTFLAYTDEGAGFVFGYLVTGQPFYPGAVVGSSPNKTEDLQEIASAFNSGAVVQTIFMFKTLSVIYFFSFCVSMLFYLGTLQWIVMKMGWLLSVTVGTTAAESLNAAANIFLGQTEAPLLIKPFLGIMTKSEIHAVMTGGFATIAGTVLAAYINFGIDASQLISASVMAAPAALAVSKLFYPETERSKTTVDSLQMEKGQEANILDAAAQGASTAVMLVLNIAASLIAFLSFVAFLNGIITWLGVIAGVDYISFEYLLGKAFIPIAFIMGVPWEDCETVATLVGLKTIVNEFAAYERLGSLKDAGEIGSRAVIIATYALCGFANPGSIGIQLGGLGAMAPERKTDLAQIVFRAFIAGCFTSFLNACVAGALISAK